MPTLRRCAGTRGIGGASRKISPALGAMSPAIIRRVVVLPQPEGPSRATMLPGSSVSDSRSTALVSRNIFVSSRSRNETAGERSLAAENLVVLFEELWPDGIDKGPIRAEDPHLVHLGLRIGKVFCDIRLELQASNGRRRQASLGKALLHAGVEHPVDEGDAQFRLRRILDQGQTVDTGKRALPWKAHVDGRALDGVGIDALRIKEAGDVGLTLRHLHHR